ncbi:MAG: major facilitator superfamily 1 [Clostridia bacterium]|nr:major facilitator superfamily 1 [Clostridia bacterium]
MEKNIQLKRNVNKNYLYILLQNIDFTRGIWMIYLAGKGMSLTQLGLLETIFHVTSFTMEVPTGAVADLFGRRISRIVGRLTSLISVIILLLSNSFWMFAVSFIFTALSYNLESGAGDALIYDSLKEIGEEDQFMKVNGNKEVFYQAASTISFLIGGILAFKNYSTAFTLTIAVGIITALQSFSFKEPSIGIAHRDGSKENMFIKQVSTSLKVIVNNPRIGTLIIFTQSIMAFCTCIFFYLQNYLKADGYNEAAIGVIYAVSSLAAAITATQIHRIERRIKEQGILLLIPIITIACIWGIALSKYHYVLFIMMMVTEGIIFVAVSDYINKMIPSENRATILSFASMVFSFFMITLFPVIGVIGDRYSLSFAFICLAMVGSILVLANSYFMIVKMRK